MVKIKKLLVYFSIVALILGFTFARVYAQQCNFKCLRTNSFGFVYGNALWCGTGVEIGDEVGAFVSNVTVNNGCVGTWTVDNNGIYGFMAVYGDDAATPERDGVKNGDKVTFRICRGGVIMDCAESIESWDVSPNEDKELNLTTSAPSANFSSDRTIGCIPFEVPFTNSSTNATGYSWDFGDGSALSTEPSPTHTYTAKGVYTVTLTATNACGDTVETKAGYITVSDKPESADFSANPVNGCAPLVVQFTNSSVGATGYSWDFGDGSAASTETSPKHTYTAKGVYTVKLTATNVCGNTVETKAGFITVSDKPQVAFSAASTTGCVPLTICFTNTTTNATGYSWDFGDGSQVSTEAFPCHTYTACGVYTLTLSATNACGTTVVTKPGYIIVSCKPIAAFSADLTSGMVSFEVTFTNSTSNATGYSWDFGDGSAASTEKDPKHTYTARGVYTVKLTATNACGNTVETKADYITASDPAIDPPIPDFTASPTTGCASLVVTFTNKSVGATGYSWDFGDSSALSTEPSPTHTYAAKGVYTVKLTATNVSGNRVKTENDYIMVNGKPQAAFSAGPIISGCIPFEVTFTNSSSNATGYSWDFGDGSAVSTELSPTHTYTTAGKYTVKLTATNACGNTVETKADYITANGKPQAAFSADPTSGCAPLVVTFTNSSVGATVYSWDFGDGSAVSTEPSPTHTYTAAGRYNVTLTAINACGDTVETKAGHIIVNDKAQAAFSADQTSGCIPFDVQFINSSVGAISYSWNFGDGSAASKEKSPKHTYMAAGKYTVTLTATNACGNKVATKASYIIVNDKPQAAFSADRTSGLIPFEVQFTNSSSNAISYSWDFGDDSTASKEKSPKHTYAAKGVYTVTLTATNANNCGDSRKTITITASVPADPPVPDFTASPTSGCAPVQVQFTNNSSGATGYSWNFGDGSALSTELSPKHTYTKEGKYTVKLTATNATGSTDKTRNGYITVTADKPVATFTPSVTVGRAPLEVKFTNTSVNAETCSWDFGDRSAVSTLTSPSHTYTAAGIYKVILTAATMCGNSTKMATIIVSDILPGRILEEGSSSANPVPLSGAMVEVKGQSGYVVTTREDGSYTLSGLRFGSYTLYVTMPGYESKYISIGNYPGIESIPDIFISPNVGWICGRVRGDTDNPVEGATIIAYTMDGGFYSREAETDPNGAYIIYLAQAGSYTLLGFKDGYYPVVYSGENYDGYWVNPEDPGTCKGNPDTFAGGVDLIMWPKPIISGPQVRISSYEWDHDPNTYSVENHTMIMVDSNSSLIDPYVEVKDSDYPGLVIGESNPIVFRGRTYYQVECSGYAGKSISNNTVRVKVLAYDQSGFTTTPYSFTVDPKTTKEPTPTNNKGGTEKDFNLGEGVKTNEVGPVDTDGDGDVDDYDGSFVDIPSCGVMVKVEGVDPNAIDPNFAQRGMTIRIDRMESPNYKAITAEYNVYLLDANGSEIPGSDIIVNEEHPITVYLHFDPNTFDQNPANMVIRYQADDGTWKTDGIRNVRIEGSTIIFEVTHLTKFGAFTSAPSNLTARVVNTGTIELKWIDQSIDEDSFEIERSVNSNQNFEWIATLSSDASSYLDDSCGLGNTYYYQVRAHNQYGYTDYSSPLAGTTVTECDDPNLPAPSDLTATPISQTEIILTWKDNSECETGFTIMAGLEMEGTIYYREITIPAHTDPNSSEVSYHDTQVKADTRYYYRIKATGMVKDSEWIEEEATTPDVELKPHKGGDDHWYDCFISTINLRPYTSLWKILFRQNSSGR